MNLELRNLSKSFNSKAVLQNLNLTIANSNCLVLIGPSGSGKSTLLRLLAGLDTPDSGEIILNHSPISSTNSDLLNYRRNIGVVFQSFNLFPHLSALENILLPLEKVHGYSHSRATQTASTLLERFHLSPHAHQSPSTLSGGQRQRVAIARALAHQPSLLLFDEPTSALDPEMSAEVLDTISSLLAENQHCILVTHEMGFAYHIANTIAVLDQGQIVETASPQHIFQNPSSPVTQRFLSQTLRYHPPLQKHP